MFTYKIIDTSTVQIKIGNDVIMTLIDVRHVPNLKKNIIALGILDSNGYKVIIESSGSKIFPGANVWIKGMKVYNQYVL